MTLLYLLQLYLSALYISMYIMLGNTAAEILINQPFVAKAALHFQSLFAQSHPKKSTVVFLVCCAKV